MAGTKEHSGGTRKGAGRPRRNLQLDKQTARTLALLTRDRRQLANNSSITEEMIVSDLVDAEWKKFDEMYERDAKTALEGEVEYGSKVDAQARNSYGP